MRRNPFFYFCATLVFAYTAATPLLAKDRPALFQAISNNKIDTANALINSGADVNVVYDKKTPLCEALLRKNYAIATRIIHAPSVAVDKRCITIDRNYDEWERTPLIIAVQEGQVELVDLLLEKGADINGRDRMNDEPLSSGNTPLMYAAGFDKIELVSRLLNNPKKPDVNARNKRGKRALWYASENENLDIVKTLFAYGTKINIADSAGASILTTTVEHKQYDVLDFLVAKGADINHADKIGHTPLMAAIGAEDSTLRYVEKFLSFKPKLNDIPQEDAALHVATRMRSVGVIKLLLDNGAQIDIATSSAKRTALHNAAISKNKDAAEYLIKRGAKMEIPDSAGHTPLMGATVQADPEMVQLLIKSGAAVDVRPSSNILLTPLVAAAANIDPFKHKDYISILKTLLDNKADVNFQAGNGRTALIAAAQSSNHAQAYEKAQLLVAKGANLDIVNDKGETALMLASDTGNGKLVKLLLQSGADVNVKNGAGESAVNYANRQNNQAISTTLVEKGAKTEAPNIKQHVTLSSLVGTWEGYQDDLPQAVYKIVLGKDSTYDFASRLTPQILKNFPAGSMNPVIAAHKGNYTLNNDILILYPTGIAPVSMHWKLEKNTLVLDNKIRLKKPYM
ncbi:MAG: ankyrin repeat domain-containing protein [Campylobacterales bacterium]|nr:ankyrin repeat domain-containing protein [Campylobacterales bacterium]